MKPGIGKPLLVALFSQFLEDSGYEISYKGKPLEFQMEFGIFLRRCYLFIVAVIVSAGRVSIARILEAEYTSSKRTEGKNLLRIRSHSSLLKFLQANPELVDKEHDKSFDGLLRHSYDVYNGLVDFQNTRRDSIVVDNTSNNTSNVPTSKE